MGKKNKHIPDCRNNSHHPVKYNEQYDAYYCEECGKWIGRKCSDYKCGFCAKRPDVPPIE